MKKLLVTLLLAAGLVTVASAVEPLDCTNPNVSDVYKCCTDLTDMQNAINQSPNGFMIYGQGIRLANLDTTLVNDGSGEGDYSSCIDNGVYLDANGNRQTGEFAWVPGDGPRSIKYYVPSSAK